MTLEELDAVDVLDLLVYGNAGVGKTVTAGSSCLVEWMCPVVYGYTPEAGVQSLRGFKDHAAGRMELVAIDDWYDARNLYKAVREGELECRTLVLDSLSELSDIAIKHVCLTRDKNPDPTGERTSQNDWRVRNLRMLSLIRAYRGLMDLGVNIVMTALQGSVKDDVTGALHTAPSFSPSLEGKVSAAFNNVVQLYPTRKGRVARIVGSEALRAKMRLDPYKEDVSSLVEVGDPRTDDDFGIVRFAHLLDLSAPEEEEE